MFQGAGHNDVELYNQYLERLKTFVAHELTNWHVARGQERVDDTVSASVSTSCWQVRTTTLVMMFMIQSWSSDLFSADKLFIIDIRIPQSDSHTML